MDAIEKGATVIGFLGIDGSGKTTQAHRLAAWLDGDQPEDQVAGAIQAAVLQAFPALLVQEPA